MGQTNDGLIKLFSFIGHLIFNSQKPVFSETLLSVSNLCELNAERLIFSLFPNFTRSLIINPAAGACIKPVPENPAAVNSPGFSSSIIG